MQPSESVCSDPNRRPNPYVLTRDRIHASLKVVAGEGPYEFASMRHFGETSKGVQKTLAVPNSANRTIPRLIGTRSIGQGCSLDSDPQGPRF